MILDRDLLYYSSHFGSFGEFQLNPRRIRIPSQVYILLFIIIIIGCRHRRMVVGSCEGSKKFMRIFRISGRASVQFNSTN